MSRIGQKTGKSKASKQVHMNAIMKALVAKNLDKTIDIKPRTI